MKQPRLRRREALVAGIICKEDLDRFITQESLIETKTSLAGASQIVRLDTLYFGVGLCNGVPLLSAALPIDILSMILIAEQISQTKHLLIADTHAIANGFGRRTVQALASEYQNIIRRAIENMGLAGWVIRTASEFDTTPSYKDMLAVVNQSINGSNEYIRRELADMLWFNREHSVSLKLGWSLNGSAHSDETSFDQKFRSIFGDVLGFVYVVPGRTFDPNIPRSAPYFCINPDDRILLRAEEDASRKLASAKERFGQRTTRSYENFLMQVLRLYDRTIERTERGTLSERLQQVIGRCTG